MTNPPPEHEDEQSYTAPVVSGHWLWSANPESGKVALIDATRMRVTTADAGLAPTYVAALGESTDTDTSAIVLNVGDDTASVLSASHGDISLQSVKVHPGANRMNVSASGRWALVWSDATLIDHPDPTEGLQDVTVLDLGVTPAVSYPLTVGYRPARVSVGQGEHHAYFVTDAGISVVDLPDVDPPTVARDVAVAVSPSEAAKVRDVTVTPDGKVAVIRRDGSPTVGLIGLDDGREVDVTLEGPVTDLDLTPDGKYAFAVVRASRTGTSGSGGSSSGGGSGASAGTGGNGASAGTAGNGASAGTSGAAGGSGTGGSTAAGSTGDGGQAGALDAAGGAENGGNDTGGAPSAAGAPGEAGGGGAPGGGGSSAAGGTGASGGSSTTPSYVAVLSLAKVLKDPSAFRTVAIDDDVGSIVIAPAGDVALLYTNATPNDHVTIFDTKSFAVVRTVVVESPVSAVLPSPDGRHAVALLAQASGSKKPGGFGLIPLTTTLPPKIVGTDAPPQAVALGTQQGLITIEGTNPTTNAKVHAVYLAQLPAFATTKVTLASSPLSAGLIPEVNLGFVAQSHPEGRITFLDVDTGAPRTLTGFELSARVMQGD